MADPSQTTPAEEMTAAEVVAFLDRVVQGYKGQYAPLDRALGMYVQARTLGWKPLYLMRDKRKIQEAEAILGIAFREHFPETGPCPDKSMSWRLAKKVSSFWRAVRGDYPNIRSSELEDVTKVR
ncbi:hypothetical protein LNKW23_48610 [Paralimibaculum aggregatum]|uniref:Uncharacterized protein n=1 Tax=Paralimibaculum aggregatum TaxID=3036245 RepID=A0ABQ6LUB4_9RHOB|nr:hypothetical protein [Limibaculum sp. NKW23]GMG83998.1 hypothetical protein LNKW23_32120 [Limibaculum sp. NKW23]GMG85636.1 hypothetical protein LNKW23_48610 [Limibaculum sp. NKW23]